MYPSDCSLKGAMTSPGDNFVGRLLFEDLEVAAPRYAKTMHCLAKQAKATTLRP